MGNPLAKQTPADAMHMTAAPALQKCYRNPGISQTIQPIKA
jgi:hypothetical protein